MKEGVVKQLYRHYGGVARFVLQNPSTRPEVGLDEWLEELRDTVQSCNTEQVSGAIGRA